MDEERIKNRIMNVVLSCAQIKSAELSHESSLLEYGIGVDSVSTMEFIVAIESEFDIVIDETEVDLKVLDSVNSLYDFINPRLG